MKFIVFSLAVIFLSVNCKNNKKETTSDPKPSVSMASLVEKKIILQEIENESRDFYKKDFDAWASHYVQSNKVHWVCVEHDVTLRASGWEDLSQFVKQWMKDNPKPMDYEKAKFLNTNIQVSIQDSMAFITMNASNIQEDGKERFTIGSRTMLKEGNKWKILSMSSYPSDSPANGSNKNVYIHQSFKK